MNTPHAEPSDRLEGTGRHADMERHLRELLALLDSSSMSAEALERAVRVCADDERVLREASSPSERPSPQRLEGLIRLNALARQRAERERDDVAAALARLRRAQAGLRDLVRAELPGTDCDVAG